MAILRTYLPLEPEGFALTMASTNASKFTNAHVNDGDCPTFPAQARTTASVSGK